MRPAIFALIIANIIWGAASPIFKFSLQNIPPFSLAYLRFLIACLLLYPLIHQKLAWRDLKNKWLWLFSLFGITFNITFFFLALQRTASINAPIIGSSGPIFILILSAIFLREKVRSNALIGTLAALVGVGVIIFRPILDQGVSTELLGNFFLVLATLGAVGHAIFGRKFLNSENNMGATFWSFFIGTISFLPLMLIEFGQNPGWIANLDYRGWIGITFGGILSSAVAYGLYNWALSKLQAFRVSVFSYLDPVIAILIAVPLLGEKITLPFIIGSVLVFVGIVIAEKRLPWHPIHKIIQK